jgi:signal transduction histidine kinase
MDLQGIRVVREFRTIPGALKADPSEIEQIFTNLFLNAIHEMPADGVLTVQLDCDEHDVIIRVGDTGKGIPKKNIPNIFDPFFTTKSKGTGMGLSVVLRIVKNYKGKIEVEQSGPHGTTFCVRLPQVGASH